MILRVGRVARGTRAHEAFRGVEYEYFFAPIAKSIIKIKMPRASSISALLSICQSGRPGPVVLMYPRTCSPN